jgi:hypothetical protein
VKSNTTKVVNDFISKKNKLTNGYSQKKIKTRDDTEKEAMAYLRKNPRKF